MIYWPSKYPATKLFDLCYESRSKLQLVDSSGPSPAGAAVYTAACCIFDRYPSVQRISPEDVQDTALSALLCASRILEPDSRLGISAMENYYRINKLKVPTTTPLLNFNFLSLRKRDVQLNIQDYRRVHVFSD